ncbi:LOW QUALITY PROTEIN: hypothetical protein Cgig2_029802 [Carnegiea gigantea]|uniref:Uncharacterized protein n=1 Tax=Carnegiea gigantea TaxID=171969 RepID=A0A9Q1QKF6_9CARY|nr:LOW QUALITY PROTEIN: hypothetical protein Cgig2_029802 [Carnegiea gigantea]
MWNLPMAGVYPLGFGNWVPVVDSPVATGHRRSESRGLDSGLENFPLSGYKIQSLRMGAPSFISSIDLSWAYHFEWGRHGVAFPPSPLLNDFQAFYELAVAEEAARRFGPPKLPRVNFYAMLLNEAERLGVLYGRTLRVIDSALTELRWSTFESWVWLNRDRIFEAWFQAKAEQKEEGL